MEAELGAGALPWWLALAALPLLLAVATAFTKVTVVLGALRVGLGAEQLIPAAAMLALALIVTAIVMAPVVAEIFSGVDALGGWAGVLESSPSTWLAALEPLRGFLERHTTAEELSFFAELQGRPTTDPLVLVPSFLVTELGEALMMAVVIIVPFVLVDLLAAQILVLLGLQNQPTAVVTLPLKLLLFLAVGGFDVVIGGLVEGYA